MSLNPPWWVPQLLQCSNKSDRPSNRDRRDRDSLWRAMYRQEQLWLTNLPSPSVSIILLFASSNLSLSLRLSRTVLVHANLSRGTHFLWNFFVFFFSPEAEINACAGRETQIKNVVPLAKEGRKIGKFREKKCSKTPLHPWNSVFCIFSWVSLCWEQGFAIGVQAMCIACNDTSVMVIVLQDVVSLYDVVCLRSTFL